MTTKTWLKRTRSTAPSSQQRSTEFEWNHPSLIALSKSSARCGALPPRAARTVSGIRVLGPRKRQLPHREHPAPSPRSESGAAVNPYARARGVRGC